MSCRNSVDSYGSIAQAFHWVIAALVFVQLALGTWIDDMPVSLARLQWLSRHKMLGVVILLLVLLRLAWRFIDPPPALPASIPAMERRLARFTHGLLYALLVAAPVTGWMHASAAGLGVNVFGLFTLPDLLPRDTALSEIFRTVHGVIVKTLAVLLVLHIAAALRHAVVLRDGVFSRMLPWKKTARRI